MTPAGPPELCACPVVTYVRGGGFREPVEGGTVTFDVDQGRKGPQAAKSTPKAALLALPCECPGGLAASGGWRSVLVRRAARRPGVR